MIHIDADRRGAASLASFRLRTLLLIVALLGMAMAVGIQWNAALGVLLFWTEILVFSERAGGNRLARRVAIVAASIPTTFIAFAVPQMGTAREPGRRTICQNNMRQIGNALLAYARADGDRLPPAYIADASGKPMHGWRTLLLCNLGQPDLYAAYNFDEAWDGPGNRKLQVELPFFQCPSDPPTVPNSPRSSYFVVTGPGTLFPSDKRVGLGDVKDGLQNTILLVEVLNSGISWMEPRDLTIDEAIQGMNAWTKHPNSTGNSISSYHPCGLNSCAVNVIFADGHARFLQDDISPALLKALLTIDGGEDLKMLGWK